jgi:negative regulator of flagellin synthesis FlgM
MKISSNECGRAAASGQELAQEKILPERMPRKGSAAPSESAHLTPLEQGIRVAEAALENVPDIREDIVEDLRRRIKSGEYKVSGEDVADMMLRRRAADQIR